ASLCSRGPHPRSHSLGGRLRRLPSGASRAPQALPLLVHLLCARQIGKIDSPRMTARSSAPAAVWLSTLLLTAACGPDRHQPAPAANTTRAANEPEWFVDRAKDYGLDFVHFNGMSGEFYYPEI